MGSPNRNASNPPSSNHTVVIIILVVVILGAIPLLYFCGRMFYRIWRHPFYTSTPVDDEEMVNVDEGGPSSLNGKPRADDRGRSPTEAAQARASSYSHFSTPSFSVESQTEEEQRSLLPQSDFSKPPSPPPSQVNVSPNKAPAVLRKPAPLSSGDANPPGAEVQQESATATTPIRGPAAMRAEQPPLSRLNSPPRYQSSLSMSSSQAFVAPGPPPPLSSSNPSSPPRQIRNPYRDELPPRESRNYPATVPDPIGPPPRVPPILTSPPASPPTAEGAERSPTGGPRPMGPRRPAGARPRSEVTSMFSTMSVTSESTASDGAVGMNPPGHQRGPLSPPRTRA